MGFFLTALREAHREGELPDPLDRLMPAYIETRALKPREAGRCADVESGG